MARKDVVLFDLDGTVLDTGPLILSSWRHVRDTFGIAADDDDFRRGMGRPLVEILGQFARGEAERTRLVDAYREHNLAHHDEMVQPFPGVRDVFAGLRALSVRIGIVTSKLRAVAERGLRVTELEVDVVIGPDDVERPKPDPLPVWVALRRLAGTRERAMMVGDSPHDVQAGKAAGVETVGVRWGMFAVSELLAARPDHLIERPGDLLPLVC